METSKKRQLAALFSDRRFLVALTVLLVATTLLLYRTATGSGETTPPTDPGGLNPTLPVARAGEPPRSKLELQAGQMGRADYLDLPGLNLGDSIRSPDSVPASLNPYLYGPREPVEVPSGESMYPARTRLTADRSYEEAPNFPDPSAEELSLNRAPNSEAERRRARLLELLEAYRRKETRQPSLAHPPVPARPESLPGPAPVTTLKGSRPTGEPQNGFFGLVSEADGAAPTEPVDSTRCGLRASIADDQVITDGGRIRLRLEEPIRVGDVTLPTGTLLYGLGEFGTERIRIRITGIRHENRLLPVQLSVYDMDGLEGVYVPRVEAGPQLRQAAAGTLGGIHLHPSAPTRHPAGTAALSVAQAGASGLRSLLQRKVTSSKAHLRGNYHVLLY